MYNDNGKIKVSNTLESRLELMAQQVEYENFFQILTPNNIKSSCFCLPVEGSNPLPLIPSSLITYTNEG